jgi:uncharacterized membrane protein
MDLLSKLSWAEFTLSTLSILLVLGGMTFLASLKEKVFSYYDRKEAKPLVSDHKKYLRPLFILGVLMVVIGIMLCFLLLLPDFWLVITAAIAAVLIIGAVSAWWR